MKKNTASFHPLRTWLFGSSVAVGLITFTGCQTHVQYGMDGGGSVSQSFGVATTHKTVGTVPQTAAAMEALTKLHSDLCSGDLNRDHIYEPAWEHMQKIKSGEFPVDATSKKGWTLLHLVADCGHTGLVAFLLDLQADINAKTESGATALHLAACKGHSRVVGYLLQQGAKIDRNGDGKTALDLAKDAFTIAEAEGLRYTDLGRNLICTVDLLRK